ncbi:MAG: DUF5009 domain-containing protein [Verrucomicrobiaceae bacterium]|nr:DUF5009 domain-containing protein [Verrucomicrobiaceae bacterium]
MDVPAAKPQRLLSLDTFRGFAMFLMAAELLDLPDVAAQFSASAFWQAVSFHSQHVEWTGCSLHDLIQPAFSFMVGVALPFSISSRRAKGASVPQMMRHALVRALILVVLGVLLRFLDEKHIHWTYEDTLAQIGLGYPFLFLLGLCSTRGRWSALAAILAGYWLFFALHPLPGPDFDRAAADIPAGWAHDFTGFAAHWNLNSNAAWAFDRWFLNIFPAGDYFRGNPEGYSTLNFIPTLGTMILGLIAGQWFRDGHRGAAAMKRLGVAGALCLLAGLALHHSGICPSVKKLWTPSWTLVSGGWCLFIMAAFHGINDVAGFDKWSFPFQVLGMNSILMYLLVHLVEAVFAAGHRLHLRFQPFSSMSPAVESAFGGAVLLFVLWSVLFVLHRRRIFLRI